MLGLKLIHTSNSGPSGKPQQNTTKRKVYVECTVQSAYRKYKAYIFIIFLINPRIIVYNVERWCLKPTTMQNNDFSSHPF